MFCGCMKEVKKEKIEWFIGQGSMYAFLWAQRALLFHLVNFPHCLSPMSHSMNGYSMACTKQQKKQQTTESNSRGREYAYSRCCLVAHLREGHQHLKCRLIRFASLSFLIDVPSPSISPLLPYTTLPLCSLTRTKLCLLLDPLANLSHFQDRSLPHLCPPSRNPQAIHCCRRPLPRISRK